MEDDSNINDTIDNDLKNRNKGPIRRKISNKIKKEAKKKAKKNLRKIRNTMFKSVGTSVGTTLLPIFIVIFMVVGIISFITSMPGLVQEKMMNLVLNALKGLNYSINGSDYYLAELAKDTEHQRQREILLYLDNMGIDPVGFGFAAFYERYGDTWEDVEYRPELAEGYAQEINGIFDDWNTDSEIGQNVKDLFAFASALKFNDDEAKAYLDTDLLLKYIISNERTYLIHDGDKIGNKKLTEDVKKWLGKIELSGMIKTKVNGLEDSSISVDRENKQMVIESLNGNLSELTIYNQTAKYNLESWTGRYGMPLEFLLAIHIGTMSSDLTDEMVSNPNLLTEVKVSSEKDKYNVSYDIKYKGEDLPFGAHPVSDDEDEYMDDLYGVIDDNDITAEDGDISANISDEDLKDKYESKISVNSLCGLIERLLGNHWSSHVDWAEQESVVEDALDAFLGDRPYRVRYEIIGNVYSNNLAVWRSSAFFGFADNLTEADKDINAKYSQDIGYDTDEGLKSGVTVKQTLEDETTYTYEFSAEDDTTPNDEYHAGTVYIDLTNEEPVDLEEKGYSGKYYGNPDSGKYAYTTGILYGLDSYLNGNNGFGINDIMENEYIQLGITCMLSQIDSYFLNQGGYSKDLGEVPQYLASFEYDSDKGKNFFGIDLGNGDSMRFYLEDGLQSYVAAGIEGNAAVNWQLTAQWLIFLNEHKDGYTYDEVRDELKYLRDTIQNTMHMLEYESVQKTIDILLKATYGEDTQLDIDDLILIYGTLRNHNDDFEYVFPRIEYVIKHWYKDVIFDASGVDVYKEKNNDDIRLPLETDNENIEITAVLSGGKNYVQNKQPYVVKGDVVTVDGEIVENSNLSSAEIDGYTLGDGYRTTKKLFTQGQYYVFDGSNETSKSIWFAKRLECLDGKGCKYARVSVSNGRITTAVVYEDEDEAMQKFGEAYSGGNWNVSTQKIDDDRKNDEECQPDKAVQTGDGWSVFLEEAKTAPKDGKIVNCYYIAVDKDMAYVSAADDVQKSKDSVERINSLLEAMGVSVIRRPVSFDNTTINGDVTSLTAFGILEGMHTESAEYIYRDLKEFLIELGYYTKAEFEQVESNVLRWFIPNYVPESDEEKLHWNQAKDTDNLKYGAMLYPTEADDDGNIVHEGFEAGFNVIAPGNCRVIKKTATSITLEFDGISQPEISALDKYTMIIDGIEVSEDPVKVLLSDGSEATKTLSEIVGKEDVVLVEEIIGKTGTTPIQIVLKNKIGGYVNNIEDYMGSTVKNLVLENDFDVSTKSGKNIVEDAEEFRELFSEYPNIADNAEAFMKMQDEYGVNAIFAAAVAVIESSAGTNGALVGNGNGYPYNMFSVGYWNGSISQKSYSWTNTSLSTWMAYDSFEQSILDFGNLIANGDHYFKDNKYTVSEISKPYCPPTADDWASDVSNLMTRKLEMLMEKE